jgi:hypothetical protein
MKLCPQSHPIHTGICVVSEMFFEETEWLARFHPAQFTSTSASKVFPQGILYTVHPLW